MGVIDRVRAAWDGMRQVVRSPVAPWGGGDPYSYTYAYSYGDPNREQLFPSYEQFAGVAYSGNAIVFGIIHRRMQLFSEATFKWRRLADKKLFGNPDLIKLEQPWPGGTTADLLGRMEQDASLAGNAFIRDCGGRLERLRPDLVTIVSTINVDDYGNQVREVVGYIYDPTSTDPDRAIDFYPESEVAHWAPIPDPLANFRGMSWLTPVVREINADTAMTDHRDAYFRNAATPNLILKYANALTAEQKKAIGEQAAARHGGSSNAFRTMVLDAGADPMVVGSNLNEAAYTLVQAAGENRIAVAAGTPSIIVGLKEGLQAATLANFDAAMRLMADLTIRPNWRSACAALQKLVPPPAGCQLWYDTADIAALQAGEADKAATFATDAATADGLIQSGWTPDSVQVAMNARDMSLLVHTGMFSVQLQKPGPAEPAGVAEGSPADAPPALNGKKPAPATAGGRA